MPRPRRSDELLAEIDRDLADAYAAKHEGEDKVRTMCAELFALDESIDDLLGYRTEVMAIRDAAGTTGEHERID